MSIAKEVASLWTDGLNDVDPIALLGWCPGSDLEVDMEGCGDMDELVRGVREPTEPPLAEPPLELEPASMGTFAPPTLLELP